MFTIKKFPIWSVEIEDVAGSTTGLFKFWRTQARISNFH